MPAMTEIAYLSFVVCGIAFGAIAGFLGHFLRAHTRFPAEDLGLGEPWDSLTRDDYQFEKHVVGAKWDDAGYWDENSNRNLAYYILSGAVAPVILAAFFWSDRAAVVAATCGALSGVGFNSPLCG
jgi:hypothetical protein